MENWVSVPDFEAYEVSDQGRVRRVLCKCCGARLAQPLPLRPRPDREGYNRFFFSRDGKQHYFRAARLVLTAFVGPPPTRAHEAAHGNGNRRNDSVHNLRWATRRENEDDKIAHGTRGRGERIGNSRLTETTVRKIRSLRRQGKTYREIERLTGAPRRNILNVVRRVSWRHVA